MVPLRGHFPFRFEGVTLLGHSKDIDDILRLLEMGINFDVVLNDAKTQKDLIEPERFRWLLEILLEKTVHIRMIPKKGGL